MATGINGETRVYYVIGDPIAQVKAPAGMTARFQALGRNAVCVPMHVPATHLSEFMRGSLHARNLDGMIVTVPHKVAMVAHAAELTPRARIAGAVNVLRRRPDGLWLGDTTDGQSFVAGLRQAGCEPRGRRALLVGAGGAGAAIAAALLDAGVDELAIHSRSPGPLQRLIAALRAYRPQADVVQGSADPAGHDLVVNASTAGMRADDPLPLRAERLSPGAFVGDVITAPEVTPLLAAARAAGCGTQTGLGMVAQAIGLMTDFFLAAEADQARLPAM